MSNSDVSTSKTKVAGRPNLLLPADVSPLAFCSGCQNPVLGRIIAEAIEEFKLEEKTICVLGIGCSSFIGFMLNVDIVNGPHGRPPDMATAIKRLYPQNFVFTIQGDGDLVSIGSESLIGALTRGEKFTIFMVNNSVYATTGGQASPTSLIGQVTITTPKGRDPNVSGYPVHTAELISTFRGVAYSARGSLSTPANYQKTKQYIKTAILKQTNNVGMSFVEILTPCPSNWGKSPVDCTKYIDDKVIKEFPLGEFKNVDKLD
jgi:2-oxoglutarate ferredoxin oxidoreductase subunit beta